MCRVGETLGSVISRVGGERAGVREHVALWEARPGAEGTDRILAV